MSDSLVISVTKGPVEVRFIGLFLVDYLIVRGLFKVVERM